MKIKNITQKIVTIIEMKEMLALGNQFLQKFTMIKIRLKTSNRGKSL
jgi:hypothetical protein